MPNLHKMTIATSLFFLGWIQVGLAKDFIDVSKSNVHYDAIQFAQEIGLVNGYEDGTFKPENSINRAEFVKILMHYQYSGEGKLAIDQCNTGWSYKDVKFGVWYTHELCRANDDHLINGYPDGTFRPDQPIVFSEAAKIISLSNSMIGYKETNFTKIEIPKEDDGPWYKKYIDYLASHNAIPTDITSFDQKKTRGQMVEILQRLKGKLNKSSQTYDSIGNINGISEVNPCTDLPSGNIITSGSKQYPKSKEFIALGFLGEVLTSEDCGEDRLIQVSGGRDRRDGIRPFIKLKDTASTNLITLLKSQEYTCFPHEIDNCKEWQFHGKWDLTVDSILKLRPFVKEIQSFDCGNCYIDLVPTTYFPLSLDSFVPSTVKNIKLFNDVGLGISFNYPDTWPNPTQVTDSNIVDSNISEWNLSIAPTCDWCDVAYRHNLYVQKFDLDKTTIEHLLIIDRVNLLSDKTNNNIRKIVAVGIIGGLDFEMRYYITSDAIYKLAINNRFLSLKNETSYKIVPYSFELSEE